jgi:rod shape-determining protein MreD
MERKTMRPKRDFIIKLMFRILLLLSVYILQAMVFPYLPLWGVTPVLLPMVVVGVALFEGYVTGGIFGIFAGILCDMSFNQPTIMFTLVLTGVGLLVGLMSDTVLARGFPSFLLCSILALMITAFFQMFGLLFYENVPLASLIDTALYQTLYSIIFSIPMYYASRAISRRVQRT